MPGILPMKVIKVGTSSQSRIAQACDRCRSKKIRCDGIRPCCSQCANVGFECRTSDKLSRRAFPRGYTESLEERVRQLETENRELKDLLDEKDEKIDMLSRLHSRSPRRLSVGSVTSPPSAEARKEPAPPAREDTFRVLASPLLLGVENSDSYFMGPSSGRSFIESFRQKIQENGKACPDFNIEAFLHIQGCYPLVPASSQSHSRSQSMKVPPRLFTDRCVNVYFQEWAPLFPVLHKPTFLRLYEEFVNDADKVKSNHKIAQLYLVFSIASLSSELPDVEQIAACEAQWQKSLDAILLENTMGTLQCLVLALTYCTIRADYKRLQHYKGVAVGLSHRLGLHQSQKRFSFGALTIETRKRVFWTLYSLDCFSAAILGLPKHIKEEDVQAEFPSDTDDEYITEKGFQPTLPGEYTKLSSALALFRASRILAKVLEKLYPASTSHEISLQQMSALEDELSDWNENLPSHLKLSFAQGKPSTNVTGSRSPLLALVYYYIRVLIFRPAVGSTLGPKAAPALINIGESSKHIIQIIQLLEERNMSFSFCLNKTDTLVLSGMTLLYQGLDLKQESRLAKDSERLVNEVIKMLLKAKAAGIQDLKRVASLLISVDELSPPPKRNSPVASMPAPPARKSPPAHAQAKPTHHNAGQHSGTSMTETDLLSQQQKMRRMTMPTNLVSRPELYRSQSRSSMHSNTADLGSLRDQRFSLAQIQQSMMRLSPRQKAKPNVDYLPLGNNTSAPAQPSSPTHTRNPQPQVAPQRHQQQPPSHRYSTSQIPTKEASGNGVSLAEWEALLGALDGGQGNVYDAIYGGPSVSLDTPGSAATNFGSEWAAESWDLNGFNVVDLTANPAPASTHSVLSPSDESLSSGDEIAAGDAHLNISTEDYQNSLLLTSRSSFDSNLLLEGLDGNFAM